MKKIAKFDTKYPGYFKSLFTKANKPVVIELSVKESFRKDTSDVNLQIFNQNFDQLIKVRQRIDNFDWINDDFSESRVFNLRNIYYLLKLQQAQKNGLIKDGERFKCDFPEEKMMKQEILSNKQVFYEIVFSLAKDRIGDNLIGKQSLILLRDLIISDAMLDDTLLQEMRSTDSERKITAFKNFYEDYKNHLPNSFGLKVNNIKGLDKLFEDFSSGVYTEISKVRIVKQPGSESYQLVEQGFLSIFRGRAGIADCSFWVARTGDAYTRAMHEDTKYLFVYKGKELKGYIGLLLGQTPDGKKILTVDTINSPSLDGQELLNNLFLTLDDLAKELGCVGIALPKDIGPSFNFDNEDTILEMDVYEEALPVSVESLHKKSWQYFTDMFGKDQYNSIEVGEFVLLNFNNKTINKSGQSSSSPLKPGGIDFRFLPIVTQSMDSLKASIRSLPRNSLRDVNLTKEWSDIERLVNSGIAPSTERLKEYFIASYYKDNLDNDMEKIVSCISDILRQEEESCCLTDPMLKDMLVVLGSGRNTEELKLALAN